MLTLPSFFNLEKVSERPRVGAVVKVAIGVNLLIETKALPEGTPDREWVLCFFKCSKPGVDLRAKAISEFL